MQKLKAAICLAAVQVFFLCASAQVGKDERILKGNDNLVYIDPTIGNVAQLLQLKITGVRR